MTSRELNRKLNRRQFCALIGVTNHNLVNRSTNGQLALARGLRVPAVQGEYDVLDVFWGKASDAMVERGFPREVATDILRDHDEIVLDALTCTEWGMVAMSIDPRACYQIVAERGVIYLAIAREVDAASGADSFFVAQGTYEELGKALSERPPASDVVLIRVDDILQATLDAFQEAGLHEFLEGPRGANFFTRHPGHPEFAEWRAEIERMRQLSADRLRTSNDQAVRAVAVREARERRAAKRAKENT